MKKEATKKSKMWLWLVIGLAALVAVAGVVLALVLGGGDKETGPVGGRPDLYWNLDKALYTENSESGLSTREPGADGIYRIRFAYNGEQVELPIADKQLVNFIDTFDIMGLVKDADGVVVDVIDPEDFTTPVAQNAYVQQVMSDRIIANSSIAMNGMQYIIEITDLTEIYDVSSTAAVAGQIIEPTAFQAMDSIWVYANDLEEVTHVYMTEHPATSSVYWRAYQMWNSAEKSTSRVPDENGVYSVDFCADGGIVTLKCKDKSIVTAIDNKSPHSCHFGFIFDDEGYIVDIMNSGIGIRGAVAAERIEVQEIEDNYFSGAQMIPSDGGLSYSATLPESCVIYDASSGAERNGVQGQAVDSLKVGDRICVWTDPMGTPVLVYIANRLQDVPVYYNLTRKYDATKKETTRETNGSGYYEFEMVETGKEGKQVLKTKDKELASFIDSIANSIVGLKVTNGIIENAYKDDDVVGWTSVYGGYIPQIQGAIVSMVSFSKPDSPTNVLMKPDFKVYDVSGKDVPYGSETTLRVGDIATVTRDVAYNGITLYITRRMVGGDCVYYNLDYQYNSTTKETKRLPDADGWYVFTMAHKGKVVEVKTKDKDLANRIEKSMAGDLVCVMRVENGVVKELYDNQAAYGQSLNSGWRVSAINGDGTYTLINSIGTERVLKMASDCVIYNVSQVYDSHRGEKISSLKIGDMVVSLADYRGEVKQIIVRNRPVEKMYANPAPLYDATNKVTLRQPDADGWYWFDLSEEGTMKRFKTKDIEIASLVDSYTNNPFGLRVKGDEILNVVSANWVRGVYKAGDTAWDVVSISGGNVTIKFNKPGYSYTGDTKTVYAGGSVKVYDISPTAESFGAAVKIKVGDRIRTYVDRDNNCVYVFVTHHANRVNGTVGYCEHCDKEVFWNPWAGEAWDGVDCHYYVNGDLKLTKQTNVGNATKDYGVVLDLNGKTVEVTGARAFLAYRGDDLTVIDSVGGGEVKATGIDGGTGGTVLVSEGSTFNLYGGTFSFIDSDANVFKGAVFSLNSGAILNIYDGTIKDGIVNSPDKHTQGGNIYMLGATINMYGGVIEGGQAIRTVIPGADIASQGGNIYGCKESVLNLYGGEIRNGYSNQHGGNLFLSTCTLNMFGGTVTGGECVNSGGNFYSQFATIANISGGTMNGGKAGSTGNNFYAAHDSNEMHISGGLITGDMVFGNGKAVSVSGTAKVTCGEKFGLSLPSALDITIGELQPGAEINVNASGAFSLANTNAQAYVDAGYIKAAAPRTSIEVIDDVMYIKGELSYCEHCNQMVEWNEWRGTSSPATGHYFLSRDTKQASQLTIAKNTDVVLDLYGKKHTSEKIRNFLVRGTLSIMDTVGGGEMITTGGEEFAGSIALVATESGSQTLAGFNLYGGTLKLAEGHPTFNNGGLIMFSSNGELNVYGGTMIGGYVTHRGGCINANQTGGIVNIYAGTITGGTAGISGGCLDISGTLNIEGGMIDGEVFIEPSCRGLSISGTPQVGLLDVTGGTKADIEGLSEGADITVKANGVFTLPVENAGQYQSCFKLAESIDGAIRATGDTLSVGISQTTLDSLNSVYENAVQMTTDGVFNAGGTVTATCPVCGTEEQWTDLATVPSGEKIVEGGHYYLSSNLEFTKHLGIYSDVCLHLNGHNISSAERAFYVEATYDSTAKTYNICTLNVMGDGVVAGYGVAHDTVPRGMVDVGGTVNFFGGTYISQNNHPAVTARGFSGQSAINVYDGTEICGNNISILVRSHIVNLYGGAVTAGTIKVDGSAACELNVEAVTLSNSNANQNVLIASGNRGSVNLIDATIEGTAVIGADLKSFALSGKTVINELQIGKGLAISLSGLEEGTDIGVIATGAFTTANNMASDYLAAGYLRSVASNSTLRVEDNIFYMDVEKVYCPHCDQDVEWSLWPGHNSPQSGHYYISDDYSAQTAQLSIAAGTDVVLDLHGNTYATSGIRNFLVRGELSIVDTASGGEMVVTGDPACYGSIAMVSTAADAVESATFNLYSGTLRLAEEHAAFARGGLLLIGSRANFNMYGGTIRDGAATVYGGNVSLEYADSQFNMYGGEILGGTAPNGASIYLNGGFNMEAGSIDGQVTVAESCPAVVLANDVKIGQLKIAEGKLVDVSGLTTGAEIRVDGKGVFTGELVNAESYLEYIKPANRIYPVAVEGNALTVIVADNAQMLLNTVHVDAEKMTADGVFAAAGPITAECPYCGVEAAWTELQPVAGMKITESGHYYLAADYEITNFFSIVEGANVCLHMNGHNITSAGRAIHVAGHLNLMGEGILSGAAQKHATLGYWGSLDVIGSANLFGGTITGTNAGSAITGRGNTTNCVISMYDGASVVRNSEIPGLGVRLFDDAEMVMYGGSISDATKNVVIECGAATNRTVGITVYGGTISGGTDAVGGNIDAKGANAFIDIQGGSITEGSVYATADIKSLTVAGKPEISALDLTQGLILDIAELTQDARIGVLANGEFTTANENAAALVEAGAISAASELMHIRCENNVLFMDVEEVPTGTYCQHCEQIVEWTVWPGISGPTSGHYYIDSDYTAQTKQISINADTDVVLDLRGHKYTTSGIRNFLVRGTFSVMDTEGNGEMVTSGDAECAGSIALILAPTDANSASPVFNLYSGTLKLADDHETFRNGGVLHFYSGTFNMYGGTISGGETTETAGNVGIDGTAATFNMFGGSILGGVSSVGGSVNVKGTMNVSGGMIEGEVALQSTANATVAGDVVIGNLNVAEGVLVDISGLTSEAQIGITASGVFTKTLTNADSYLNYLTPFVTGKVLAVKDNAIAAIDEFEALNAIHTAAEQMTADGVFNAGGTVTAVCPVCGTEEQWVDIATVTKPSEIKEDGHYYLSADHTITKHFGFYANACLHLNGHNISSTERALYVEAVYNSTTKVYTIYTLNIMGEGTVSGAGVHHASIPRGTVDIGGSVNFFGGTYVATGDRPAVTARGFNGHSVINIYDGATFTAPTTNLLVRSQGVNIYGGEINGGAIKVDGANKCALNVYGGTIGDQNNNQVVVINAAGASGALNIQGGMIHGTVVVAADLSSAEVSGDPRIAALDLTSGKLLTVGALNGDAMIKVAANGAFTAALTNAEDLLAYFAPVNENYQIMVEGTALAVRESAMGKGNKVHLVAEKMTTDAVFASGGDVVAVCPACEQEVTWKNLNAVLPTLANNKLTEAGHYYLSDNLALTSHISAYVDFTLHLNGHNITSAARVLYAEYVNVSIMGSGTVTGGFTDPYNKNYASVLDVPANLNLYGGTYTATTGKPIIVARSNKAHTVSMFEGASVVRDPAVPGLNVRVYDEHDFIMYGGVISGGSGTNGGNVLVQSSSSTARKPVFAIYGGVLENGSADLGGNIYAVGASASVEIHGGSVVGGDVYMEANTDRVFISGAPVVSELDLTGGKLLSLGELKANANITVNAADGAFTETCTLASEYAAFFKALQEDKKVLADGDKLIIANK